MHISKKILKNLIPILIYIGVLNSCSNPNENNSKQYPLSLDSLANKAYYNNDYKKAIILFDSLISIDSTRGDLYYKMGYAHMMSKDKISLDSLIEGTREEYIRLNEKAFSPAINDFLKSIDLGFEKPKAYLGLGAIYTFINDSIALKYFTKSLQEDPSYEKARNELQSCEIRIKNNQHLY